MACAAAWLQSAVRAQHRNRIIVVVDEAWAILSNLGVARWLQTSWKLSRAMGVANMAVLHRLSDLRSVGTAGSEQVNLAEGLLADSETRVVYAQSPGEVARTGELLGLTDTEAELVTQLRRGMALWKVGRRSFLVEHRLASGERWLTDTDQAMDDDDGRPHAADGATPSRAVGRLTIRHRRSVLGPPSLGAGLVGSRSPWLGRARPSGRHSVPGARAAPSRAPGATRLAPAPAAGAGRRTRSDDGSRTGPNGTVGPAAGPRPSGRRARRRGAGPPPGRLVLGTVGRRLVAAERAQSVIVFGPTQSHKTSGLRRAGHPRVGGTGGGGQRQDRPARAHHRPPPARWEPSGASTRPGRPAWPPRPGHRCRPSRTWPGARRAAAALTEVAKSSVGTMTDGDFWYATATRMLAPLLFAAAFGAATWRTSSAGWTPSEEAEVLDLLAAAGVPEAIHAARSAFGKEDRQRSSIYTTVETMLEPFADRPDPRPAAGDAGASRWSTRPLCCRDRTPSTCARRPTTSVG